GPRQIEEIAPTHLPGEDVEDDRLPQTHWRVSRTPAMRNSRVTTGCKDETFRVLQTPRRDQAYDLSMDLPDSQHTTILPAQDLVFSHIVRLQKGPRLPHNVRSSY